MVGVIIYLPVVASKIIIPPSVCPLVLTSAKSPKFREPALSLND